MENLFTPPYAYEKGYIALHVALPAENLPETIGVVRAANSLIRKDDFHVSLVCVKCILEKFPEEKRGEAEQFVLETVATFLKQNPLADGEFKNDFRYVRSGEKETVIVLYAIANIAELFSSLSKQLGQEVPVQPTHVTLYTAQKNVGIGITSPEAMESAERLSENETSVLWAALGK